ncbi:L-amino-acid oxidase [Lachnellula suecica]|uniref:L-amino-acid oxidase n=1 Tax=Lachnellula suecica TaxID=602035 RepID=A0A8T9CII8_9HELO|nr:L-amino-acid oxidase [Lachnellula suecica]
MAPSLLAFLAVLAVGTASVVVPRHESVGFSGPFEVEADGIANIHVTYNLLISGHLSLHYGSCDPSQMSPDSHHHLIGRTAVGDHPLARRHVEHPSQRPERFVWIVPANAPSDGCLIAYSGSDLLGRSAPVLVKHKKSRRDVLRKRDNVAFADIADSEGPWFDGVEYLKQKEPESAFVAASKTKKIGILGGGMSGLMSSFLLTSVGFHDWQIIEASARVGGRVHTSYLNGTRPDQYQYQERVPSSHYQHNGPDEIPHAETNETIEIQDHKMVFQLADAINNLNGNDSALMVKFIKWIQSSPNTPASTSFRLPDGTVPSKADIAANPALADNVTLTYSNATAVQAASDAYDSWINLDSAKVRAAVTNVFTAHKAAVAAGYLDFSESGYLRYKLGIDANITDEVDSIGDNLDSWYYETPYFSATTWRTIDQGLSKLPMAFMPLVSNRTLFNSSIQALSYNETTNKVTVSYRPTADPRIRLRDLRCAVLARAPVETASYTSLLSRAIQTLNYSPACKVSMHYKTRFWEHDNYAPGKKAIFGGCGATDIPGVGSVCYPSYALNSSGPGVILANYNSGLPARSLGSFTEAQHVAHIQKAMVEIHGAVAAEQWTGNYDRICWEQNEFQAGAWCSPLAGQQSLYLPAYYHTEKNTVWVGEHTSFTHAWIWSALESAVRGTTQLLLDMGLVDEAKEVTETRMARWISV